MLLFLNFTRTSNMKTLLFKCISNIFVSNLAHFSLPILRAFFDFCGKIRCDKFGKSNSQMHELPYVPFYTCILFKSLIWKSHFAIWVVIVYKNFNYISYTKVMSQKIILDENCFSLVPQLWKISLIFEKINQENRLSTRKNETIFNILTWILRLLKLDFSN